MNSELVSKTENKYKQIFFENPSCMTIAPGRINLIGEHTDYSDGFVLPVAIDRSVAVCFTPRNDHLIHIYSVDFEEEFITDLEHLEHDYKGWKNYIIGMAWAMNENGLSLNGWQGVISGNIPIGAGLSSSAAFEIAVGKTFCMASNLILSPTELALLSRKAEREWIGVNVGIMDQLISAAGKANHAVLLDCQNLAFEYVPIPEQIQMMVLDTNTRRELVRSDYNNRHDEVNEAANILEVNTLRFASMQLLEQNRNNMPPTIYKRAKHVVTENERVSQFAKAMRKNDLIKMGDLMDQSHISLSVDFEVSSTELNLISEIARNQPTCFGARMMGAGFGGCALALIKKGDCSEFISNVCQEYQAATGIVPQVFEVKAADGVSSVSINLTSLKKHL